jgi:glycosyltransferase involved in cell wall biosynthesis
MVAEVSLEQVIGGAERVLRAQAEGLAARGHAVRVLTRAGSEEAPTRVEAGKVAEIRYAVNRGDAVAFFLSTLRNARRAWCSLLREALPDVVIVHQTLPGLAVPGRPARIPMAYVCHSLAHEEFESRNRPPVGARGRVWYRLMSLARRWTERAVVGRAREVIVLSDFMRRRIIDCHHVRADRVRVIPGGVDPAVFCPASDRRAVRASLGLAEEEFVLFTVRNLVPRMGLDTLIQAVAELRTEIPRLRLLIGGSGPLRFELEGLVKALGLADCVRLLGFVPESALPDYYRAADLFVLPTAQLEGFGLVTVEALASGTPAFGTRIGATEEILGKLDVSLLSSGPDTKALAAGIGALCRRFRADPGVRARLAEAGRALVQRDFTWDRHCARVEEVLLELRAQR